MEKLKVVGFSQSPKASEVCHYRLSYDGLDKWKGELEKVRCKVSTSFTASLLITFPFSFSLESLFNGGGREEPMS